MKYSQLALTVSLLSLPPLFLIKYLKQREKKKFQELQQFYNKNAMYKLLFITNKNLMCMPHIAKKVICGTGCSFLHLKNLVSLIENASIEILVCMYHLSISQIYEALINARIRGVQVFVITDITMTENNSSKAKALRNTGIPVKVQSYKSCLMHHKFVVIDKTDNENRRLVFGSLNYTLNAFLRNWEYVIMTDDKFLIDRFSTEFDCLWSDPEIRPIQ